MMASTNRLRRSSTDRMISGVSGGLAEHYDIDPSIVRIGWVALCFVTGGLALLLYISMIIIMPKGIQNAAEPAAGDGPPTEETDEGQEPTVGEGDSGMSPHTAEIC